MTSVAVEKGKTMSDYIKREDAIDTFESALLLQRELGFDFDFRTLADSIPSADVIEHKYGKWLVGSEKCTCCGGYGLISFNFCPNCGADMRGDDNETD